MATQHIRLSNGFQRVAISGSSVISETIVVDERMSLLKFQAHLVSGSTSGSISIWHQLAAGPEFKVQLDGQSLSGVNDYIYEFDNPQVLQTGDSLILSYSNPDRRTYGLFIDFGRS